MSKNLDTTSEKKIPEIPYITLYIGYFITIVITYLFFYIGCKEVKDLSSIFTIGIITTTLVYTAKSLRQSFLINQENFKHNQEKTEKEIEANKEKANREITINKERLAFEKKKITIELLSITSNLQFMEKMVVLRRYIENNEKNPNFVAEIEKNDDLRETAIVLLNYFEKIAIAIKYDIIDEDVTQAYCYFMITYYQNKLNPFIRERRRMKSPTLFTNIDWLCAKWQIAK